MNAPGSANHDPSLQRHHILPCELLHRRCFSGPLEFLGQERLCFDDFRTNGLLLPADDRAAVRLALPLHRGPHRAYNQLVIERAGQIEAGWARHRPACPEQAGIEALLRLRLLQAALRRRLLDQHRRLLLNRSDPLGRGVDFTELDAMAAMLWAATEPNR